MTQDFCNGRNGTFRVQTRNVACGSTGVTCTKTISVQIGDTVLRLEKGKKMTAKPITSGLIMTAKYQVVTSGVFTILATEIGVTVVWDRATTVYVALDPKYKGIYYWNDKKIS